VSYVLGRWSAEYEFSILLTSWEWTRFILTVLCINIFLLRSYFLYNLALWTFSDCVCANLSRLRILSCSSELLFRSLEDSILLYFIRWVSDKRLDDLLQVACVCARTQTINQYYSRYMFSTAVHEKRHERFAKHVMHKSKTLVLIDIWIISRSSCSSEIQAEL